MEQKQLREKKNIHRNIKHNYFFHVPSCYHAYHSGLLYYSSCCFTQFSSTEAIKKDVYLFVSSVFLLLRKNN